LKYEKKELAEKLGISRPTLDSRLKNGNWKKLEIEKIIKL
jgi:DNA-binding Xre family transcriptional regulator